MILDEAVVGDCVGVVSRSGAPGAIIPEISIGDGFLARCRALERSCYAGDDSIEAARFFTRQAFEACEGYDENLSGPEDWDLSMRIAGGNHFPRVPSHISHDEGRLRLGDLLIKKRYYAASFLEYQRKHGQAVLGQANLILRPAFLRNWRLLLRHPILTMGFLSLKSLEAVAGLLGLLDARFSKQPPNGARPRWNGARR
jgi:hypothetical protein